MMCGRTPSVLRGICRNCVLKSLSTHSWKLLTVSTFNTSFHDDDSLHERWNMIFISIVRGDSHPSGS